jgi:F-type H+-transporting ATPase subunit b
VNLLSPNWGLAFWLTLTFLILLFVLRRYAWGPIVSAMEEREKTIDSSIQRAEEALAEAKEIQADNEKARREAEQKAQRILREAREQAEQLADEERQTTQEQIDEMKLQAHDEIGREKQSALNELRSEVADLAVQAAGKILHEDMNQDRQRRMVDEFLEDLPRN